MPFLCPFSRFIFLDYFSVSVSLLQPDARGVIWLEVEGRRGSQLYELMLMRDSGL